MSYTCIPPDFSNFILILLLNLCFFLFFLLPISFFPLQKFLVIAFFVILFLSFNLFVLQTLILIFLKCNNFFHRSLINFLLGTQTTSTGSSSTGCSPTPSTAAELTTFTTSGSWPPISRTCLTRKSSQPERDPLDLSHYRVQRQVWLE